MNNAEKFNEVFGIYATELWAKSEAELLEWLRGEYGAVEAGDVEPVIHGHWVVDEDGNIKCSECGYHGVGDNYCERCGAKMDEENR